MLSFISYTGIIASIWIVAGVIIASLFYPNYSHSRQFCSELGAAGSPTQKLSPLINNYPLGLLFILFGYYLISTYAESTATVAIGIMVVIHGLSTWVCGFFPMDADPYTTTPTIPCQIHSWSGMVMLISFIVAPAIAVFSDTNPITNPTAIRVFSLICLLGCFYFTYRLSVSFKERTNPGTHQRLSYGFQILWLFVYSAFMIA